MTEREGDTITESEIDAMFAATNEAVRAKRAHFGPLIAAITDEQARLVIDLGQRQGLSMNRIAIEMRPHLDWEIPDFDVISVGWDLYLHALKRFDLYDPDIRPFPERLLIATVDGVDIHYTTDKHLLDYEVDGVVATLRPVNSVRFGIDAGDHAALQAGIADLKARSRPAP